VANRLRVLYVVQDFPPEALAGTQLSALWLAEELCERYEVHIFTGTRYPSLQDYSTVTDDLKGLTIRRIKIPAGNPVCPTDLYLNRKIEQAFESYVEEVNPNLVHIHHVINLSMGIIERTATRRIPMLLHIRDFYYLCPRIFLLDSSNKLCEGPLDELKCAKCLQASLMLYIPEHLRSTYTPQTFVQAVVDRIEYVKKLLLLPDIIVCPSGFMKEKLVRFGVPASKIEVHPDGVRELPRVRDKKLGSRVTFGFLGGLYLHKGAHVLLEAFSKLDQSKAELLLYGGGDQGLIQHGDLNIRFMGEYSHQDLPNILSKLDVLVHPSICHESYSLVIHEALAAGVPVVVSDIPAQRDYVKDGANGLRFKVGDPEDLKCKMEMIVRSPETLLKLRKQETKVKSIEEQTDEIEIIYLELIQKTSRSFKGETLAELEKIRQRAEVEGNRLKWELMQLRLKIDPMSSLLALYVSRPDLQSAFPEVMDGKYSRVLQWARDVLAAGRDSASSTLAHYAGWYKENEWLRPAGELGKKEDRLPWRLVRRYGRFSGRCFPGGTRRRVIVDRLAFAFRTALDEGFGSLFRRVVNRYVRRRRHFFELTRDEQYQVWLSNNELTEEKILQVQKEVSQFSYKPKITVAMPVYNAEEKWLRAAIDSVIKQVYSNWELCIVDDASTKRDVKKILEVYQSIDRRIKVKYLDENLGISGASNEALAMAGGEFVGFLDHDDELTRDAFFEVVKLLNQNPNLDLIYSDEDKKDLNGRRVEPFFKPDWSPDLLLSMNYVSHFSVVRKSLVDKVGGLRRGFEGSQDYDLILRVTELTNKIGHIPKPLYSWRKVPSSAAVSIEAKPYARESAKEALRQTLSRRGFNGEVLDGFGGYYRVRYAIREAPLVSIIIPTKDRVDLLKRCIRSIESKTSYKNYEIIIIDNNSTDSATLAYLESLRYRVVKFDETFNFSKIDNLGAKYAKGEHLLFLNNDIEVADEHWLNAMIEHSQRPEVGVVGALLLYPRNRAPHKRRRIQHAGVILGVGGVANHAFRHLPAECPNYFGLHRVVRNCSAVTAACAMIRRNVFEEVNGFDENLRVAFGDVDLCLRVREKGYLVVYTPYAMLYHHERATRGVLLPSDDEAYMIDRWSDTLIKGDPYYNSNLTLLRGDYSLASKGSSIRPLSVLLDIYYLRPDLQRAYPEAHNGDYSRLIDWAIVTGITVDSQRAALRPYRSYYASHTSDRWK